MTLNELGREILGMYRPPSDETVSEWADAKRIIVGKGASEPGPWHTDRAPYQREIMDAYTQKGIHDIVIMSAAQIGKTDMMLNMIGRNVEDDPGPTLMVFPTDSDLRAFSTERLQPTIDATPALSSRISDGNGSTIYQKNFPNGFIAMAGAMAPSGLKSRPIRYLFMDEVDGYPASSGTEGDPVNLASKRTQTFFNAVRCYFSTPTLKATSRIYKLFLRGTREEWEFACKHCGAYSHIVFDDIRFEKEAIATQGLEKEYEVTSAVWRCPKCRGTMEEHEVKRAKGKWVAYNPKAVKRGIRSFHLNTFISPWGKWKDVCKKFLDAKDDPEMLKTFYNLELGLPFERKQTTNVPELMYLRREPYSAEVPRGVLVITIGIDTQDNYLVYEVKGWGRGEEQWGIQYGMIPGRADEDATWEMVDALLDRKWKLENGKTIRAAVSFMDCQGHYYDDVVERCNARRYKRLYAIRGDNKDTGPLIHRTESRKKHYSIFNLNVQAGKRAVLFATDVANPGPRYMHYPDDEDAGYDEYYFLGLISERIEVVKRRGTNVEQWVKVYERNEPLDVSNYAYCAFKFIKKKIDMDAYEARLYGTTEVKPASVKPKHPKGLISSGIKL